MLAGEISLEVIGSSPRNQEELEHEISRSQPDVIVLDEASHLACPTTLLFLLIEFPNLRIVVVSANHDLVHIYQKQEVLVTGSTQLANIICNGY